MRFKRFNYTNRYLHDNYAKKICTLYSVLYFELRTFIFIEHIIDFFLVLNFFSKRCEISYEVRLIYVLDNFMKYFL